MSYWIEWIGRDGTVKRSGPFDSIYSAELFQVFVPKESLIVEEIAS